MSELKINEPFPPEKKSGWLRDSKLGLTKFIIGKEAYELYGDVYAICKNSPYIKIIYEQQKQVTGLQILADEYIFEKSQEFWVIWRYLNDCYDFQCLEVFLEASNPLVKFSNFEVLANYFRISLDSPFYREVMEMRALLGLKDIESERYTNVKNIMGMYNICKNKSMFRLKIGKNNFYFTTSEKATQFKNMYCIYETYVNDATIDYNDYPIALEDISDAALEEIELDPTPPSLFEKTTDGKSLRIVISVNDTLAKKLEYIRYTDNAVYRFPVAPSNYSSGETNMIKISLNPFGGSNNYIPLGSIFPLSKLVVDKNNLVTQFSIQQNLRELGISDNQILNIIQDLYNKGIQITIAGTPADYQLLNFVATQQQQTYNPNFVDANKIGGRPISPIRLPNITRSFPRF